MATPHKKAVDAVKKESPWASRNALNQRNRENVRYLNKKAGVFGKRGVVKVHPSGFTKELIRKKSESDR